MKTDLKTDVTIKEICDGFVYNELEGKGLFGLSGNLTIQPEYQRNYIARSCIVWFYGEDVFDSHFIILYGIPRN